MNIAIPEMKNEWKRAIICKQSVVDIWPYCVIEK